MLESLLSTSKGAGLSAGTPYLGGFYVGEMLVNGTKYSLIVAPRASGENSSLVYDTGATSYGPTSIWDGAGNTAALVALGTTRSPAAKWCKALTIGGYTDWVLPAQDQLELCYRMFKPTAATNVTTVGNDGVNVSSNPNGPNYTSTVPGMTTLAAYQSGGSEAFSPVLYWGSGGSTTSSGYAQTQLFSSGRQVQQVKATAYYVRAVRMVAHT